MIYIGLWESQPLLCHGRVATAETSPELLESDRRGRGRQQHAHLLRDTGGGLTARCVCCCLISGRGTVAASTRCTHLWDTVHAMFEVVYRLV